MKCVCGMNGICVESFKVCNCDIVNNVWYVDGGYLIDLRSLFVKILIFSVDGISVIFYYVFGSFECYGLKISRILIINFLISEILIILLKFLSIKFILMISGK